MTHPEEVTLKRDVGVVENRRFFLVDESGERLRSSLTYWPVVLTGRYDAEAELLAVRFPDSTVAEGSALELGEQVSPTVAEDVIPARIVEGPWTESSPGSPESRSGSCGRNDPARRRKNP